MFGFRERIKELERQRLPEKLNGRILGQFQRSINAFLKRHVASDLPFRSSSLLVGSQTKVCVSVALGIRKVFFFFLLHYC